MNSLWRIELLGGLRVSSGERVITRFRTHKTGALLAYLALFAAHPHPREALLDLFWGDEPLDAARNALRVALSSLRRQMEPPGTPQGTVLVADRRTVRLHPDACTVDVAEFAAALQVPRGASGEQAVLARAAGLYRGDLLPEVYDDWATSERERLAQAHLGMLHRLARLLLGSGDLSQGLDYAHRAAALDPLCEKSHRLLMRLHAAMGRPEAARHQFQALTQLLRAELGAAPSPETQALAARLDAFFADPEAEAHGTWSFPTPAPDTAPPFAAVFPPAALPSPAAPPPAGSLPVVFTRFFGRAEERKGLSSLLLDPQTRLVTLTGAGGIGKTRLATETAHGLGGIFPGGTWFVPLAEVDDPDRLGEAVLAVLCPSSADRSDPWAQIIAALSGPPALLILDNFEQIAAGGAPSLPALLARAPAATCLVTSRRRLDVPGEREWTLTPLPVPLEEERAEQVAQNAGVQVFVDRAQAVRPDFAVTDRDARDLAALCRALEGIPLALELAAARIRVLSVSQMRARLEQHLALPPGPRGDGKPARHRSLQATIAWSYALLPGPLQRFFACLGVFRGGWTAEAAEAVCQEPAALELLAQLRASSMLLAEDSLPDLRFRLLETLRVFAWEHLSAGEREAAEARHAAFFAALAGQADTLLQGPEQGGWLRRFEADAANFLLALDRVSGRPEEAFAMLVALYHFWLLSGRQREGRVRLDAALACWPAQDAARADALAVAGNLAEAEGDLPGARARMEEGLALHTRLGRDEAAARLGGDLGIVASRQGRLPEAQAYWEATLAYWQSRNEPRRAAGMLNNLGILARRSGDTDTAQARFEECLALFRQIGDQLRAATVLSNLGLTADSRGEWEQAAQWFEESLALQRALGNSRGTAITLHGLGLTTCKRGRAKEAQAHFAESLTLFVRMEDTGGILHCLQGFADTWMVLGLPEPAAVVRGALTIMYQKGEIARAADEAQAWAEAEQSLFAALGPERAAAAQSRGEALSPMYAAEYALSLCRLSSA